MMKAGQKKNKHTTRRYTRSAIPLRLIVTGELGSSIHPKYVLMNKTIILLVTLLFSNLSIADCPAPKLNFENSDGNILGFKIIKLWNESERRKIDKDHDTLIKFGDYDFIVSAKDANRRPIQLNIDTTTISKKLLAHLKSSPDYLNPEKQAFTVSDIQAYDLSGDAKANLILFNVSPGANVYSGAVGIINGTWKTLVAPTCY